MIEFTFKLKNRYMAYYCRDGFPSNVGIALSQFENGEPPEVLAIDCDCFAERPPEPKNESVQALLKGKSPEERKAVRARLAQARREALRELGIVGE